MVRLVTLALDLLAILPSLLPPRIASAHALSMTPHRVMLASGHRAMGVVRDPAYRLDESS
jgi:hypothetical protein